MVEQKGINLFYYSIENRKECSSIRKIEPLRRALAGIEIWITVLRKQQSQTRNDMSFAELDNYNKIIKVNTLLNWSEQLVCDYIHRNNIPFHPLHSKGHPSIECQTFTSAIILGDGGEKIPKQKNVDYTSNKRNQFQCFS